MPMFGPARNGVEKTLRDVRHRRHAQVSGRWCELAPHRCAPAVLGEAIAGPSGGACGGRAFRDADPAWRPSRTYRRDGCCGKGAPRYRLHGSGGGGAGGRFDVPIRRPPDFSDNRG